MPKLPTPSEASPFMGYVDKNNDDFPSMIDPDDEEFTGGVAANTDYSNDVGDDVGDDCGNVDDGETHNSSNSESDSTSASNSNHNNRIGVDDVFRMAPLSKIDQGPPRKIISIKKRMSKDASEAKLQHLFKSYLQSPQGRSGIDMTGLTYAFSVRSSLSIAATTPQNSIAPPDDGSESEILGIFSPRYVQVEDKDRKYPQDFYSLIALNGPCDDCWPFQKLVFFLFGLITFLFQISFLGLLFFHFVDFSEIDDASSFFATVFLDNVGFIIRATQIISIATYVLYPGSSLVDVVKAFQLFPWSSEGSEELPIRCIRFSCILRGIQGILATVVLFFVIMTSDNVLELILNFTAMHFVSDLDDKAFSLAKSGVFGPGLKEEAIEIAATDLPSCMYRKRKHLWYWTVMLITGTLLFGWMSFLMFYINSSPIRLRVEFREGSSLIQHSGCFGIDDQNSFYGRKKTYSSYSEYHQGINSTSFGYCLDKRRWIFFVGSAEVDPCDAKTESVELARSSKTDSFDISTSFDEPWVTSSGKSLELYFFENGEDDLNCGLALGDGKCDQFFNELVHNYDEGDCCGATCTESNCGRGGLASVFDKPNITGINFPYCKDPAMESITIRLNNIISSRNEEFAVFEDPSNRPYKDSVEEKQWREKTPVNPYFDLQCDGRNVLTVDIDESMVNHSETVKVEDKANCTLIVRNTTTTDFIATDEPIWFIDYTIFHGDKNDTESGHTVEILTQHSSQEGNVTFKRLPQCYIEKIGGYINISSVYSTSDPRNEAVSWLLAEDADNSKCKNASFIERFALSTMVFAMNGRDDVLIEKEDQCKWPSIVCTKGRVTQINMDSKVLEGPIASELSLLPSLEALRLSDNQITSIPSEISNMPQILEFNLDMNVITSVPSGIGKMTNLMALYLRNNKITSIPSEIGNMRNLNELWLDNNYIASIPNEIGLVTNLNVLHLLYNEIKSIPSEIRKLTNLTKLGLGSNAITTIPKEIGSMTRLEQLWLADNQITIIPSEIGLVTNLKEIFLGYNQIKSIPRDIGLVTGLLDFWLQDNSITSIPKEIGYLTNLNQLLLDYNEIAVIPTHIGLLENLEDFQLRYNQIAIIPSEIGKMTKLTNLKLDGNRIKSIPTEIGKVLNLENLWLDYNFLTSFPSEIGLLTNLNNMFLVFNNITSIPREINNLSNLKTLELGYNQITSLPTAIGIMDNLMDLKLGSNQISSIPSEIGKMTNLTNLEFDDNNITSVPSEIGNLVNLIYLTLNKNRIISMPSHLGLLTDLKELWFDNNKITFIPSEIGLMTSLKLLNLNGGMIKSIPSEIGNMSNLRELWLDGNQISSVPSQLGLLTRLTKLSFVNNPIASIPSELGKLTKLDKLEWDGNSK